VISLTTTVRLAEARGLRALLSTYAPLRGRSLCALGRHDEAEPLARLGRELGDEQEAAAVFAQALERYRQKKNLAISAQVRDRLAELQDAAQR
jgi:hypothetical protein